MGMLISGLDLAIILLLFVTVIGIGVYLYRRGISNDDYIIAGRKLKWYAIGFHGAATYVGVGTLMGALGWVYFWGVSGALYPLALTLSFAVMAIIAGRLRMLKPVTTGDILESRFNEYARIPAGIAMLMAMIGSAAAQIRAFGVIGNTIFGVDTTVAIIIISAVALLYTVLGGMLAVAYTDVIQGFIMVIVVIFILLPVMLTSAGGIGTVMSLIPASFKDFSEAGWTNIASYFLVYGLLLSFYTIDGQRAIFASKGLVDAKKGSWFAFILLAGFTLAATLIGLSGYVLMPGIEGSDQVFITLVLNYLPVGLIGLGIGGIFAAGMSTYDTSVVASSAIFTKDFFRFLKGFKDENSNSKTLNIIISVFVAICITLLAMFGQSILWIINLGFDIAACIISVPMVAALFWPRATSSGCLAAMAVGFVAWLYMFIANPATMGAWFAIPASLVVIIIVSLFTKPEEAKKLKEFYADFGWIIGGKKYLS